MGSIKGGGSHLITLGTVFIDTKIEKDEDLSQIDVHSNDGPHLELEFFEIESPDELLHVLQSLIPLKKHPILEDTYIRGE